MRENRRIFIAGGGGTLKALYNWVSGACRNTCHSELVSESVIKKIPKQVRDDNKVDFPRILRESESKNAAFTLTELLVALGVIAILCTILMPMIFHAMPNQNALMAKKAFYATQTIVSELINDDNCYPDKTNLSGAAKCDGFDDGFGYANCPLWGGSSATSSYISTSGSTNGKFFTLFFDKLNTKSVDDSSRKVETTDGMYWSMNWYDGGGFTPAGGGCGTVLMYVDVNGLDKGPNCGDSSYNSGQHGSSNGAGFSYCAAGSTTCVPPDCSATNKDRFMMQIKCNGKITITDEWAKEAVSAHSSPLN